jgi:O-antigen/teichoic acid export membrane protein
MTKAQAPSGASRNISNLGSLVAGQLLGDVFLFALFILISQRFGQDGLGTYSFAIALTNIFAGVATFGLHPYTVKELNRSASPGALFGSIISTRLILCSIAFLGIWLTAFLLQLDSALLEIVLMIGVYQLLLTLIEGMLAVYVVQQKMMRPALALLGLKGGIAIVAAILIFYGASLRTVLLVFPIVSLLCGMITFRVTASVFADFRLATSKSEIMRIVQDSLPFAIVAVARRITTRVDVILLTVLIGVAASGIYNAAYRVVFLMLMAPNFAGWVVMTIVASRDAETSDRDVLTEIYSWSLLIGLPISAGLCVIAPEIVALLFGSEFLQSAEPLRVLSWLVVMACIAFSLIAFLSARDKQKIVMRCQIGAAIVAVSANLILIPLYGVLGAAIGAIFAEGAFILALILLAAKSDGFPLKMSTLAASVLGASVFFLLHALFDKVALYWFIPLCAASYVAVLMLFSPVRKHELNMLWQWFRSARGVGSAH